MSRYIDADALIDTFEAKKAKAHDKSMKHLYGQNKNDKLYRKDRETESRCEYVLSVLRTTPTVDAVPVVRCGECRYKPHWDEGANEKDRNGFDVIFPDFTEGNRCPCQCSEDRWYSWIPNDDWYCANGERRSDD